MDGEKRIHHDFDFSIADEARYTQIRDVGAALASEDRLRILRLISQRPRTLSELSAELGLAVSSVSYHIDALVRAQLVYVQYRPGPKGHTKLCSIRAPAVSLDLNDSGRDARERAVSVEMPIGNYVECDVTVPCGIAGDTGVIGRVDDAGVLFTPERTQAQLLWFHSGKVSYNFPNPAREKGRFRSISFSMEICSEAMYHRNEWPSDVTVWINGKETATCTLPGDFGGRRGKYTPAYWSLTSTQYGLLKHFSVTEEGAFADGAPVRGGIRFADLKIEERPYIRFTIGVKEDAPHAGGLNLFGARFGDFPQAIVMTLSE